MVPTRFRTVTERFRRLVLPFLLLAYPITFVAFRGDRYCGSLCVEPTPGGAFKLIGVFLVLAGVAGAASVLRGSMGDDARNDARWLSAPTPRASVILFGIFALFVVFLFADASALYEPLWKPVVLPLSFLLFFPVWVLYMASFPLALLFSVVGVDTPTIVTLAFRGLVVFVGFPLSAVCHSVVISAIVDRQQSSDE